MNWQLINKKYPKCCKELLALETETGLKQQFLLREYLKRKGIDPGPLMSQHLIEVERELNK